MMAKVDRKKDSSLLRIVKERAMLKEAEEEKMKMKKQLDVVDVPVLPQDCVSCILLRLPIDALQRSICVCKLWCSFIHSPSLIQTHTNRSEAVILFQTSASRNPGGAISLFEPPSLKHQPNAFSIEDCLFEPTNFFNRPAIEHRSKLYVHFLEFANGKGVVRNFNISCLGKILGSCNGLILLENKLKKGGLILMNPVTRKLVALPVGTISKSHERSYALAFDPSTAEYKVVHLFHDESKYTSCEILVVGSMLWKMVNPPSIGLISWFGCKPVFAVGALHWIPHIDHNDYVVSMEVAAEKFRTIELPKSGRTCDRILEIGSFLCFATCEEMEMDRINIWALKNSSENKWTRIHSVEGCCSLHMIPISGSRFGGHIIFKRDEDRALYVYDFHLKSMRKIDMSDETHPLRKSYFHHVNSLVSWEKGDQSFFG